MAKRKSNRVVEPIIRDLEDLQHLRDKSAGKVKIGYQTEIDNLFLPPKPKVDRLQKKRDKQKKRQRDFD